MKVLLDTQMAVYVDEGLQYDVEKVRKRAVLGCAIQDWR